MLGKPGFPIVLLCGGLGCVFINPSLLIEITLFKCHHPALKYAFKITVVAMGYKVLGEEKDSMKPTSV